MKRLPGSSMMRRPSGSTRSLRAFCTSTKRGGAPAGACCLNAAAPRPGWYSGRARTFRHRRHALRGTLRAWRRSKSGGRRLAGRDLLGQLLLHPRREVGPLLPLERLLLGRLAGRWPLEALRSRGWAARRRTGGERLSGRSLGRHGTLLGRRDEPFASRGLAGGRRCIWVLRLGRRTFVRECLSLASRRRPLLALLLLALGLLLLGLGRRLREHERIGALARLGVGNAGECNGEGESADQALMRGARHRCFLGAMRGGPARRRSP